MRRRHAPASCERLAGKHPRDGAARRLAAAGPIRRERARRLHSDQHAVVELPVPPDRLAHRQAACRVDEEELHVGVGWPLDIYLTHWLNEGMRPQSTDPL